MTETTDMTLPRRVLAGTTYLVTRRCLGRRFLLRPDPELNDAFVYCLARAAEKYRIEVHALSVMSNHYHIVLTDPEGVLPLFAAWLNRQVAMCVKRLRRWDEVVWEPNVALSAVEIDGTKEVLDKVAYTVLNPVSAGLVRSPECWPGAVSTLAALREGTLVAKRPSVWFKDTAPEKATLRWTTPQAFSDRRAYHRALSALVAHRLVMLHQRPGGYLGSARVKRTSVRARPTQKKRRFGRNPTFSALTRERWLDAAKRLRAFRQAYREAYLAWRDGCDPIEFPLGTWWLARYARAPVAA